VILSGALTITARNPVHSVLWLILAFFNAAGLMLLAGAEFIAMLLVIVYVGAVAVLFLFVVMMLDIDFAEMRAGFARYCHVRPADRGGPGRRDDLRDRRLERRQDRTRPRIAPTPTDMPNIQALGGLIYTRYLYIFEAAGLVLLVAMIGAIVLTHRTRGGTCARRRSRPEQAPPAGCDAQRQPPVGQGVEL
jgi:NADH-quinone oxidoreductase subunit J